MFTRGQTQALSVLTLGALGDYQLIDGLGPEIEKRFMHHYNFPNFSVGETGPVRAPGRREIGHGALGERALRYIIPDTTEFPYTIRIVSEVRVKWLIFTSFNLWINISVNGCWCTY